MGFCKTILTPKGLRVLLNLTIWEKPLQSTTWRNLEKQFGIFVQMKVVDLEFRFTNAIFHYGILKLIH